jgi:hypothetical protein
LERGVRPIGFWSTLFQVVGLFHLERRAPLPQLARDQVDQHLADQARFA